MRALSFFLPKSASTLTPDGTSAYEAQNVRPLNVTNCDNRLIASAARIALEPWIGPTITPSQRGFIHGRSMLANIVDVDEAMGLAALGSDRGMAFSFDLAAAFPSVEHQFFFSFFSSLGWPTPLLRFVRNLYLNNYCWITLGGERSAGYSITRGIRQGCPFSLLLFAMATLHRTTSTSAALLY